MDDPTADDDGAWPEGEPMPDWVKESPEYAEYRKQLEYLIPLRLACIKRFFLKNKYHKAYREEILADAEESEEFIARFMGDDYVHFVDAIPEIKEFLEELKAKEAKKLEEVARSTGRKAGIEVDLSSLREGRKKAALATE